MAIENGVVTSAFNNLGTTGTNIGTDKSVLGKDDFLKLLLVELQNQDPTSPQDTDKILQQTSQLATLEASQNTNDSLSNLSASLTNSSYYSTISSIGKMASLGATGLVLEDGNAVDFDVYFPEDISGGEVTITNSQGIVVDTLQVSARSKGSSALNWEAVDKNGQSYEDGNYAVGISYTTTSGETKNGQFGVFPIEAVRFTDGEAQFKLGSTYVAMSQVQEIYNQ
jgi:flagellar basal-body rod modification protein FlgD